jgi:hypothetical protein
MPGRLLAYAGQLPFDQQRLTEVANDSPGRALPTEFVAFMHWHRRRVTQGPYQPLTCSPPERSGEPFVNLLVISERLRGGIAILLAPTSRIENERGLALRTARWASAGCVGAQKRAAGPKAGGPCGTWT